MDGATENKAQQNSRAPRNRRFPHPWPPSLTSICTEDHHGNRGGKGLRAARSEIWQAGLAILTRMNASRHRRYFQLNYASPGVIAPHTAPYEFTWCVPISPNYGDALREQYGILARTGPRLASGFGATTTITGRLQEVAQSRAHRKSSARS